MTHEISDWLAKHWSNILSQVLAGLLLAAIVGAVLGIVKVFRRERRAWFAAAALAVLVGYVFLWLRYTAFRVYITPALTLGLGVAAGIG